MQKFFNIISLVACLEFVWAGYKWLEKAEVMVGPIPVGPAEWFALSVGGVMLALITGCGKSLEHRIFG